MRYTLTTTSDSYHVIKICDGIFQIQMESSIPFKCETGFAYIPELKFWKKFGLHWIEYKGKEERAQPLDWYILKFFYEYREGTVPKITEYLTKNGYNNSRTGAVSTMTQYGIKRIKKRIDDILSSLGCLMEVVIKNDSSLEIHCYRDQT